MPRFKRILCPTDFSEISLEVIPYAVELARLFDAEVFFIHVVHLLPRPPEDFDYQAFVSAMRANAEDRMSKSLGARLPRGIKHTSILVEGHPAEQILRAVDEYQIDLVTIATHGLTGWRHLIFGSVAEKVVRLSRVPVLTIRGDSCGD